MKRILQHQQEVFQILTETISEGIVIVNSQQNIIAANEAANKMFGYEKGELIDQNIATLIPHQHRPQHQTYAQNFTVSGKQRSMGKGRDLNGLTKTGQVFPVEVGLNPFVIDEEKFILALITDISERKHYEEKIIRLNSNLESLVAQRTEELKQNITDLKKEISKRKKAESKIKASLQKEKELNELKTKFLSLVSHEFKTPLNVILSSATLTGKYTHTDDQPKREKHINTIKAKVKSLNNILNEFLSIERIESGANTYHMERFPLSRVINNVIYDANMLSKEGQEISYPDNINGVEVYFDEKILSLSLTNIINNAIKYAPENSKIDIRVTTAKNQLLIHVKDEGIGIPEEEQKFIFNPYFRAENVLLKQGTGIGLNIVKGHLENLNSSIYFESRLNAGSTFTICIPHNPN